MRCATLAALAGVAAAAVPADKVTNLPTFGAPLSDTYSGYLTAGTGKHLHYFFTAALESPASAPVVLCKYRRRTIPPPIASPTLT